MLFNQAPKGGFCVHAARALFSEESDNLVRGDLAEVVYHRVCPVPTQISIFVAAPSTSANQPRRPAITPVIASSAIPALGDRQSTLAGRWHCRKILGSATQLTTRASRS